MKFADDFYSSEYLCSTDGMLLRAATLGSFIRCNLSY